MQPINNWPEERKQTDELMSNRQDFDSTDCTVCSFSRLRKEKGYESVHKAANLLEPTIGPQSAIS